MAKGNLYGQIYDKFKELSMNYRDYNQTVPKLKNII